MHPFVAMRLAIRKDTGQVVLTTFLGSEKLFRLDHEDERNRYIVVATEPLRIRKRREIAGAKMAERVELRTSAPPKRDRWGRFTS